MFVIIGTTTVDLFVLSRKPFAQSSDDGFRADNLIFTDDPLLMLLGGNGGCSAYVLASLGVPTALCSAAGQDALGEMASSWLIERGVNLDGFAHSEASATSTSTIVMNSADSQIVFHHQGANQDIRLENIPPSMLREAEGLLVSSFPIIPRMRESGFAEALSVTHQAGGVTAVDIGPAIGRPASLDEIGSLLPDIDYLIANEHELAVLTGINDWEVAATHLIEAGANCVIIKRGDQGAAARGHGIRVDVPGFAVDANICVGAGDSFNVGFLYGAQQGWPLAEALRFGNAVAALVVSGERGVLGAPTMAAVKSLLASRDSIEPQPKI